MPHRLLHSLVVATATALVSAALASHAPEGLTFDLSTLPAETHYDDTLGYGWEASPLGANSTPAPGRADNGSGQEKKRPRAFSVKVAEGNYRVTLRLAPTTTVKAETRRLMLEPLPGAEPTAEVVRQFYVNVRRPALPPAKVGETASVRVCLSPRETTSYTWDDKLTLEFSGPGTVRSFTLAHAPAELPTLFLIGDSTVTDQASEDYASWGQMLPSFLPSAAVANHAHSGESIKSSLTARRIDKVLSQIKRGDLLLIQFGHNDQKPQYPQTYLAADSTYPAYLRALVAEARLRRAIPILITSPQRRNFDAHGKVLNTHGDYPQAVRDVATSKAIALIDLEQLSRDFYEALGPERSALAFADNGKDRTHHNSYGAYVLALFVARELRTLGLALEVTAPDSGFPRPESFAQTPSALPSPQKPPND